MSDLINRQDAIDAISTWDKFGVDGRGEVVRWYEGLEPYVKLRDVVWAIEKLPSAEPNILDDGTLTITVPHGMLSKVNRVIVDEVGTKFCKMMYQEEPQIIRCKDCKYFQIDGNFMFCNSEGSMFADVTKNDYCSYAERREEE